MAETLSSPEVNETSTVENGPSDLAKVAQAIKSSPDPMKASLCLLTWLQTYIWRLGAAKTDPTAEAIGEIEADLLRDTTQLRDDLLGLS